MCYLFFIFFTANPRDIFFIVNAVDGVKKVIRRPIVDVSKTDKVFGIKYRSMDETAKDMLDDFRVKGWIN